MGIVALSEWRPKNHAFGRNRHDGLEFREIAVEGGEGSCRRGFAMLSGLLQMEDYFGKVRQFRMCARFLQTKAVQKGTAVRVRPGFASRRPAKVPIPIPCRAAALAVVAGPVNAFRNKVDLIMQVMAAFQFEKSECQCDVRSSHTIPS